MKCECPIAGYCPRHKINKGNHWHKLCQTDKEYYTAWENGVGPGQKSTQPPQTGTELKKLISWFPVPKSKTCHKCKALETKMNQWGPKICKNKKPYILNKLRIAAARRKLPFSERLVSILIDKAIKNST